MESFSADSAALFVEPPTALACGFGSDSGGGLRFFLRKRHMFVPDELLDQRVINGNK